MQNDILNLAKQLITIPSTNENIEGLNKVLHTAEKELTNFTIEKFEKDSIPSLLVYSQKKRADKFKVILNAHLDVVPAPKNLFTPYEKNGKLFGRGSNDMKSAAAVELLVFKELAQQLTYPLALQLVTDEEIGGFKGTKYQIEQGVRAEFVIAGEPTDFGINNKAKGIIWVKIKTTGNSAHGAYPWQGDNAIKKMEKVLNTISEKYPTPQKEVWATTINVSQIETSNKTFNKVPDDCTLFLDVRYIPEDKEKIISELQTIANSYSLEIVENEPSQFTDENNPYIQTLQKSAQKIIGKPVDVIVKHGGSDIRHFNAIGADGVTFGPIGAGLHTDHEWVETRSLEEYYIILKDFLLSLNI